MPKIIRTFKGIARYLEEKYGLQVKPLTIQRWHQRFPFQFFRGINGNKMIYVADIDRWINDRRSAK
ncbi:MAG: hypothetical protein QME51_07110 [Planctomycetota bacterium]|nr:hypothetical protein [Planctomycetota bacterium]